MTCLFAILATTGLERLRAVPLQFWLWLVAAVIGMALIVLVLRRVAGMNRLALTGGALLASSLIGFNWIYERDEPSWATPAVEAVAGFFPTKEKAYRP